MSNPYGPNQSSQWGGPQAPNGQYPVGTQGGATYGAPSTPRSAGGMGTGYGQSQGAYYGVPPVLPQMQPAGGPSYGSGGGMPPRKDSHAGLIIGIIVAVLVILLMIVFAAVATSNRPRSSGQAPASGTPLVVRLLFGIIVPLRARLFQASRQERERPTHR